MTNPRHDKDQQSIIDILDSINLILEYSQNVDWKALEVKDQDAIILRFIVVGEATKRLSKALRSRNAEIPWKKMAGLRDVVVHDYDDINLDVIKDVVELELPKLLSLLKNLSRREFEESDSLQNE